jgi:hypothetical protein
MAQPAFERPLTAPAPAATTDPSLDHLRARVVPDRPFWRAQIQAPSGVWLRLHSVRDPLAEARSQASAFQTTDSRTIVLLGCGLGYLAEVLLEAVPDARVIAVEPCADLANACLERRDWSREETAGRFTLRHWANLDVPAPLWQLFDRDEPDPIVVAHPVIEREWPSLIADMRAGITRIVFDGRANAEARRRQAGRYLVNSIRNLDAIAGSADVAILENAFAGVPAVVVAAGPSLDGHLASLKALSTKALIIAVDTSLRPLANAGIRPHLGIALDPTDLNARHLIDLPDVSDTWLVAEPSLSPAAVGAFRDRLFTFRVADHHPWPWLSTMGLDRHVLRVWGSVLTAGLDLAILAGANPITFVGADLAFTENRPYCRGAIWEQDWAATTGRGQSLADRFADDLRAKTIEYVDDCRGLRTPTTPHLLAFRNWLLSRMREERGIRFLNASGAGILFGDPVVQTSLTSLLDGPNVSGIRDRIRTFAFQGDRKIAQQRRTLAAGLRCMLDRKADTIVDTWAAFGRTTVERSELQATIGEIAAQLALPRRDDGGDPPAPGALVPAADRAAFVRAALVSQSATVIRHFPASASVERAFRQLQQLLGHESLRSDPSAVVPATLVDEPGRVPASLLLDLPRSTRNALAVFEDTLARACAHLELRSEPEITKREVHGFGQRSKCSTQPALATALLVHEWLSVARHLSSGGADDGIDLAHWLLEHLIASWSKHGADEPQTLQLVVDGVAAILLPDPRELPTRELTGLIGLSQAQVASVHTTSRVAIRRHSTRPDHPSKTLASHPWLQLFDRATLRLVPETLTSVVGRSGLGTTLTGERALITPVNALASVEVQADGDAVARRAWPRPIWGEVPFGPQGGALAWHNPDRVVLIRRSASAAVEEYTAPFRPLRVAIDGEGVPMWIGFEGGLWRWMPGEPPTQLVETPAPIHLHVLADGSVRLDPATRGADGAAIRQRRRSGWRWRPGAPELDTFELGDEAQCTSFERANGWSAAAHPYADLVLLTTPDGRTLSLGVHYPLTVAWAGASLVVCAGEGDVLLFRHLTDRVSQVLG